MEVVQDYLAGFWQYLMENNILANLGKGFLKIVAILILMRVAVNLVRKIVNNIFHRKQKGPFRITERREETLNKLIQNVATYIIYFTSLVMDRKSTRLNSS